MTPLEIVIALEYAVSGEPGANILSNIWNSPAGRDARRRMEDLGLVKDGKPTGRLYAWVKMLSDVPLPVQVWLAANTPESENG